MTRIARFACLENLRVFTSSLFNRNQQHRAPFLLTLAFIQILSASCTRAAAQTVRSSQPQTSPSAIDLVYSPAYNFNSVNVGATSSSTSVTFTFFSPGSIAAPVVVTQGAVNLDFNDDGTGTCTTNGTSHTYNTGDTCTVNVTFTPKSWGPRYGAIELQDSSGNSIATVYLQGIGIGPQPSFPPGSLSPLPLPGLTTPNAIAIDGQGNLYFAETIAPYQGTSMVIKETWANGTWTQSTVMTGLDQPLGVAVDGAGKVYVADISSYQPYVATPIPTGGTATTATVSLKVEDFTLTAQNGGSVTASPGAQATYTLAVSTPSGDPFPQAIAFAVTGLPSGATATFSPSSLAAGSGATNVTLTVTVSNSAAMQSQRFPFGAGAIPVALGLILLPFSRTQRRLSRRFFQLVVIAIGSTALFAVLGCSGGGGSGRGTNSTPTPPTQPQSYSLIVTASSGSLSHSTTLNLTVK